MVARRYTARARTGMIWSACAVDLTSSDSRKTNLRPLRTVNGTVSVPHLNGRAGEALPLGHNLRQHQECDHWLGAAAFLRRGLAPLPSPPATAGLRPLVPRPIFRARSAREAE